MNLAKLNLSLPEDTDINKTVSTNDARNFSKIILKSQNQYNPLSVNKEPVHSIYTRNPNLTSKWMTQSHFNDSKSPEEQILHSDDPHIAMSNKKYNLQINLSNISNDSNNQSKQMTSHNNQTTPIKSIKLANFVCHQPKSPLNVSNNDIRGHSSKEIKSRSPNNGSISDKGQSFPIVPIIELKYLKSTPDKEPSLPIVPVIELKYLKSGLTRPESKETNIIKLNPKSKYKDYDGKINRVQQHQNDSKSQPEIQIQNSKKLQIQQVAHLKKIIPPLKIQKPIKHDTIPDFDDDLEPIKVHIDLEKLILEENDENEYDHQIISYPQFSTQSSYKSTKAFKQPLTSQKKSYKSKPIIDAHALSNNNPHQCNLQKEGLRARNGGYAHSNKHNDQNQSLNSYQDRKKSHQQPRDKYTTVMPYIKTNF